MSSPENALLAAIYGVLSGDAALTGLTGPDAVFDRLLSRPRLPAIVFGECETRDYSTSEAKGFEHFITVEIWSEAEGRKALQAIEARVRALLDDVPLVLADAALVSILYRSTRVRRVAKSGYFRAEMRFRAVTEPV